MKNIILVIIGLALASPAWAAQTAVTQISGTQASVGALKTQVNTKLGTVESNRQDHEARVAAMETGKETKAVVQASAPADTSVDWYDTDQESGVLILKRYNGTTWLRASSYGVQYASSCASITAGMCVDTDDGKLYYHSGTAVVEVGTGTGGATAINDLTDVDTTGKATGKILKFDASGNLVVGDDSTGSGSVPDGTADDQILTWDTDQWVASTLPTLEFDSSTLTLTSNAGVDTVTVKANTYQAYDANMISWPSTISATEVGYLNGLTEALSTSLAGKEAADPTIVKVAEIDTQSEFEALLGWTLPTGGGAGGYVTAPIYSDSVCTAGTYSFHATYGVVYCRATNTWDYQVVSGSSLAWASWNNPTPVTYAATLTITDTSATGDTFTLNSIAYDAADSPVSVTNLPTATEQITYTGSNTAACTGDVTGTGPWTINDSPATVGCTVTASVAACNTMLFDESGASTGTTGIGANTAFYYAGIWNIRSSTVSICKIDANIQASESLTGRTIYVERWSVVGTTLTTKLEDITTVDGSTISTTTGDVSIAFGKTVSVGQNEAVVFTLNSSSSAYLKIYYTATGSVSDWRAGSWTSTGVTNDIATGTDFLWTAYGN